MVIKKRRWITDKGSADEYLRRVINNLYRHAKKKGLTYISTTIICDADSDYVGIRAKSGETVVSDEHCFKEMRDGD